MDAIFRAYPGLFPEAGGTEQAEGPAAENRPAEGDAEEPADAFADRWGWISLVDTVSETQRCSWDEVWRKPMIETLNTFAYAKDRNARREDELERYKRTH